MSQLLEVEGEDTDTDLVTHLKCKAAGEEITNTERSEDENLQQKTKAEDIVKTRATILVTCDSGDATDTTAESEGGSMAGSFLYPEDGVMSMKSDDSMDLFVDFRGAATDTRPPLSKEMMCCICSERAQKSCLTCSASFCENHVKHHYTAPALQKHTLVDAGSMENRLCHRHNRILEMLCLTDQTVICSLCIIDHNGHNISYLAHQALHQPTPPETLVEKVPPPPGQIKVTSVKFTSISLSWGSPAGLREPQRYRVMWRCGGVQRMSEVVSTSVDFEGLAPGKEYHLFVATLRDDGSQSPWISTSVHTEVPQPENLSVVTNASSASVAWTEPEGVEQCSFSISLQKYIDSKCLKHILTNSLECSFDVQPDTKYIVTISTVLNGQHSRSIDSHFDTSIPAPEELKLSSVTAISATLSWNQLHGMEDVPHSFLISYHSEGTGTQTLHTDSCSRDITGLKPHTQYSIRVITKVLNGGESQPATITLMTGIPAPEELKLSSVTAISATLSWNQLHGMEDVPHSFLISYHSEGTGTQTLHTDSCSRDITGLKPHTQYSIRVITKVLNGGESQPATITLMTGIPAPEELKLSSVTAISATLSWNQLHGMEDVPHSFLITYHSEGTGPQTLHTDSCSRDITGLKPHTQYSIRVITKVLNGGESQPATITLMTGIDAPQNLEVVVCTPLSACITWSIPLEMHQIPHKFGISCESELKKLPLSYTELCNKVLKGLKPDTKYRVTVTTVLKDGTKSQASGVTFTTGTDERNFFQDLGLHHHLKKKMTLNSVLEISHTAVYQKTYDSLKDLPAYFLRNLLGCKISSFASVFENVEDVTKTVNPLDLITAIFHCSDPFLQQVLCSKMSQCQLSVPLLLPNFDKQQNKLMLWAMRDIVKTLCKEDPMASVECRVAVSAMPLVSFVRLGKSGMSKSFWINTILSQGQQRSNAFLHSNMACGDVPRKISEGLVEISWYFPGVEKANSLQKPVAFANLRGDVRLFEAQFSFLYQTSVAVFVFINDLEKDVSILTSKDRTASLYLIRPGKTSMSGMDSSVEVTKKLNDEVEVEVDEVILKGEQNDTTFSKKLRSVISSIIQKQEGFKSIEDMSEIAGRFGIDVDEACPECQKGQEMAKKIVNSITDIVQFKDENLPCQGQYWKEISRLEKEKCQLKKSGQGSIEHYKSSLNKQIRDLRTKQRKTGISNAIDTFIDGITKKELEKYYFLKSLRMYLDCLTKDKMSDLLFKYKMACTNKSPEAYKEAKKLEEQISQGSLGLEHFFRELGQLYEATCSYKGVSSNKKKLNLPDSCAQLLLDGFPLELLDGDASNIPLKWIENIFICLRKKVKGKATISVVTVLGVQSTGKSTLLNTLFGIQFAVNSGKCTRGAFMQLVKVSGNSTRELKCDFILVIDTEGLKSPQLAEQIDSYEHDNALATLVIGLSDVTIINLSMENTADMKDILQIAVHAFLRMKEVGKNPRCLFVHQNVTDVLAYKNNIKERNMLVDQLNKMTAAAARMEKKAVTTKFTDVMHYDQEKDSYYIPGLWHGLPPMASVSEGYCEEVYKLKKGMISCLKGIHNEQNDILKLWRLTKELWQAVRFENFIFNFRNSLVAEAYSKLCQEWNKWEWAFCKEMYNWSLKTEARISNSGMTEPDSKTPTITELKSEALQKLNVEEDKILLKNLKQYFDDRANDLYLVEKYRSEFEMSAKSLRNKTQLSLEASLQAALDVQNGKKQLKVISTTQTRIMETKVMDLLKSFKGKEQSEASLEKVFNQMWTETTSNFPHCPLPKKNVATDAFHTLHSNFRTLPGDIKKLLFEENLERVWNESEPSPFKVNYSPFKKSGVLKRIITFPTRVPNKEMVLKDISNRVITKCKNFIFMKAQQQEDYKHEHLQELLSIIDSELQMCDIEIDQNWLASLKIHIFGIAIKRFQTMHQKFIEQNDPQKCLERAKEKFLTEFINIFHDQDRSQRKAEEFSKDCLRPAVQDYVMKRIGPEIVDEMKSGFEAVNLSSRLSFQYKLLLELLKENDYEKYKKFIHSYETFVQDWIFDQTVQKMSADRKLQNMEKNLLDSVLKRIINEVTNVLNNPNETDHVEKFVAHICKTLHLVLPEDALESFRIMNSTCHIKTKEFASHLKENIEDKLRSIDFQYDDEDEIRKRLQSLVMKPQEVLFKSLVGCGKQCPFCSAPCEAGGSEHTEHFSSIHRPQGASKWHGVDSKILLTDICSSSVMSNRRFKTEKTEGQFKPYKDYKKFYPEWNIPGDPTIEATAYWKYFLANFNEQIARDSDLKPAMIPDDWKTLSQDDALDNLKQSYYKS